jgi:RhoGAP domain/MyTH4 domain
LNLFATENFIKRRKGIFRKKLVPFLDLTHWTNEALDSPLLVYEKQYQFDAIQSFRKIQFLMGDRLEKKNNVRSSSFAKLNGDEFSYITELLQLGLSKSPLRDELYIQVCKQIHGNPSLSSVQKGWELLCMFSITFPPSKNLQKYLAAIMKYQANFNADDKIRAMASYCSKKIEKICRYGNKGKIPTRKELERALEAPFSTSNFGDSLNNIIASDRKTNPDLIVPKILTFLTDAVLQLNGPQTEGIFRVPADSECIAANKVLLDRAVYDASNFKDAHIAASLLKLWLRELEEPLIPSEFYDRSVNNCHDPDYLFQLLNSLPEVNRHVAFTLLSFLKVFAQPENSAATKMTIDNLAMVFAPSFLRCPFDNPSIIFSNAKFEQAFVKTLLTHTVNAPNTYR